MEEQCCPSDYNVYYIIWQVLWNQKMVEVWEIWTLREVFLHICTKYQIECSCRSPLWRICARSQRTWLFKFYFRKKLGVHSDGTWNELCGDNCRLLALYFFIDLLESYYWRQTYEQKRQFTDMHEYHSRWKDRCVCVQLSILELCLILLVNIWYMWTYTHQVCTYGSLTFDLLSDLATFQYHRYPAACHRAMTLMCWGDSLIPVFHITLALKRT